MGVGRQTVVAVRRDAVVFFTRLLHGIDVYDGSTQVRTGLRRGLGFQRYYAIIV